jgi:hypothetical protein
MPAIVASHLFDDQPLMRRHHLIANGVAHPRQKRRRPLHIGE